MTTGLPVHEHGIVGNGWYDRDTCEIRFWQRSNRLIHGEKVWETARQKNPQFTCANLFWWYNSYSTCDYIVQARPIYKADGRKLPDCYTHPLNLRDDLQRHLGQFPLFHFWGPLADISSTQWIAQATKRVHSRYSPTLTFVYLPHLDYPLQKFGPDHPDIPFHVGQLDKVVGDLLAYFRSHNVEVLIVSEYGIESARSDGAIALNRIFREHGLLSVREEQGLELLDPGTCQAFAVADHQIAHVYLPQKRDLFQRVQELCLQTPGVERVEEIEHSRAGELTVVAAPGYWFTYDYWTDDRNAPDFARTVDIHRKPGYDPRELFNDASGLSLGWKLLKRKLGFRQLLDVVPLDTSLVRGTHGRPDMPVELQPLLIGPGVEESAEAIPCETIKDLILSHLFD